MSDVFFISDLHFGHRNILKYRSGFKTVKEHDEHIISQWNSVVRKGKQQVWVLGDVCIKNKEYDMESMLRRLKGTIHIITGNHCHLPYYETSKVNVRNGMTKKYGFWLTHSPIHPQELRGHRNIHGHVHSATIDDNRYINVCCENINYTPMSIDEIRGDNGC